MNLKDIDLNELELAVEREKCKRSMAYFVSKAWEHIDPQPYQFNWHMKVLCEALQAVSEGKITRLAISLPPGHSKSLTVSVFFQCWEWGPGGKPHKSYLSTSNSQDFSERDARRTRELLQSDWFQMMWPLEFKADQDSKTNFGNTSMGQRTVKSFASLTGGRGNRLIIDDPISVDNAFSAVHRDVVKRRMLESVPNRLNNLEEDAIIIIAQRTHESDIMGVVKDAKLDYDFLVIPERYEGNKELLPKLGLLDPRTTDGELLFPSLFPENQIKQLEASLGPYGFSAQYQQRPVPRSDGFFDLDKINWYTREQLPAKKDMNIYMASDNSLGRNDYAVHVVYGIDRHGNYWFLDSYAKVAPTNEAFGIDQQPGGYKVADEGALALVKKWEPKIWFPEDDNTWKSMENFVKQAMRNTGITCRIIPLALAGQGNKEFKALSLDANIRLGSVYWPEHFADKSNTLAEFSSFPMSDHDDRVDAHANLFRANRLHKNVFVAPVIKEGPVDGYRPIGHKPDQRGQGGGRGFYG